MSDFGFWILWRLMQPFRDHLIIVSLCRQLDRLPFWINFVQCTSSSSSSSSRSPVLVILMHSDVVHGVVVVVLEQEEKRDAYGRI